MKALFLALPLLCAWLAGRAFAGGVTVITHGLNGNTDGWVTSMADDIPAYPNFPGPNSTTYQMYFFLSDGNYYLAANRVGGTHPTNSNSGEIIVKLDWRDLAAGGDSYNTYQVASAIVPALLNTNFIPELGGRALAEFPLHFIGHSRGGSLFCEVSRQLGTNGVWIDHLTTLDPHPLNDPVFPWDWLLYDAVDAPVHSYENILFHDNYWQDLDAFVYGRSVAGAYIRKLTNLNGGYAGTAGPHSDVHLWYHGTVDWEIPTTDSEATISATERLNWWSAYEASGFDAGFIYSLIGGADRTSMDQPVDQGFPMIRDGYNQWWDLGAGVANNRTALPANNGNWPNLIKFNRTTTNQVVLGQGMPVKFFYQWAKPNTSLATLSIYLDADFNPLNTNQTLLRQIIVPGNGASSISYGVTNLTLYASNAAPGFHAVLATITGGGRTRYLYAPELVEVIANRQPPVLDITRLNATQYRIGVNGLPGQTVIMQSSTNLVTWSAIVTNTLATNRWDYTNTAAPGANYYRGVVP
jgi:hypothetical protein